MMIAAIAKNYVIGQNTINEDGTETYSIPWDFIPEDMKRFKAHTKDTSLIMGRKTYESLPGTLKYRQNIIMTKQEMEPQNGIYIAKSIEDAIAQATQEKISVMGGSEIYKLFLPLANRLEITRINLEPEGNVFFPEFNLNEWNLTNREDRDFCAFETYIRK